MLKVSNLAFEFPDRKLIKNISFVVKPGYALHVTGANGAGKTTLLRLLAGLLIPADGEVSFKGGVSYLSHQYGVNLFLTPFEHLRFDLNATDEEAAELLQKFNLERVANKPLGLLSDGQKRRVSLMQLIYSEHEVWLLDEPLVGLDAKGMALLGEIIQSHLKQEGLVIFTSHQALPFPLPRVETINL